jgi:hypothetical protein
LAALYFGETYDLASLKFKEILAGEEGIFFGKSIPGMFHVFDHVFSLNKMVFGETEFA